MFRLSPAVALGFLLAACGASWPPCEMAVSGALTERLSCETEAGSIFLVGGSFSSLQFLHIPADRSAALTTRVAARPSGFASTGTFTSPTTPFWAYVPEDANHWWGDASGVITVHSLGGSATLSVTDVEQVQAAENPDYVAHGSATLTLPGNPDGGTTGTVTVSLTF